MMNSNPLALLEHHSVDEMSNWSEEKREDFTKIFTKRTNAARYILLKTAKEIFSIAESRKFVSQKHLKALHAKFGDSVFYRSEFDARPPSYGYNRAHERYQNQQELDKRLFDRPRDELDKVAKERAKLVIKELPPLKKAVQVIDAKTALLIERSEELKEKCQALFDELSELPTSLDMEEIDDSMTLGEFKSCVKELNEKRETLGTQLSKFADEGNALEIKIAKKLYMGLPGLSDAVMDTVIAHIERSDALSQFDRRVTEQVKFGDSQAAMDLLANYEKDEIDLGDSIKEKFSNALSELKASIKKLPKANKKEQKSLKNA